MRFLPPAGLVIIGVAAVQAFGQGSFDGTYNGLISPGSFTNPGCIPGDYAAEPHPMRLQIINNHVSVKWRGSDRLTFEADVNANGTFHAQFYAQTHTQMGVDTMDGKITGETLAVKWGNNVCRWTAVLTRLPKPKPAQ